MIISVINQKGGVGKTITSANLSACLAQKHPLLLVDLDPQSSLSNYFEVDAPEASLYDVLIGSKTLDDVALQVRSQIRLVPSTLQMSEAEARLPHLPGSDLRLARSLRQRESPDGEIIVLDCPSGWGATVRNAVLAATHILIPINSESAALETAIATESLIKELCDGYDRPTPLFGVLLTCYRDTRIARAVAELTAQHWGGTTFSTVIRRVERINELTARRATIMDVSESAAGSARSDYAELAKEIQQKWLAKEPKPRARQSATLKSP